MCRSPGWPRFTAALIAAVALGAGAPVSRAQSVITGTVTDSAGLPVFGAEVSIRGGFSRAISDDRGTFRLSEVPSGAVMLQARRLGFVPVTLEMAASSEPRPPVHLVLPQLPTILSPVTVATTRVKYTGRLAGYYQRLERRSTGYFITRDQIDRESSRQLTQLLQGAPGVTASRARGGISGVRLRGRNCWPLVWFDGVPMPAGEVDLDSFSPHTLHGIELYSGSTTAPAKYILNGTANSCGTILLWSRGPDTDPIISTHRPAQNLERLLASRSVFMADQVDQTAVPDEGRFPAISYPPALFAAGIGGVVVAEFVVDVHGRVERGTFGVVSSTNPLFSEAVNNALQEAVFTPAVRGGLAVRQLVQQSFSFVAPRARSAG